MRLRRLVGAAALPLVCLFVVTPFPRADASQATGERANRAARLARAQVLLDRLRDTTTAAAWGPGSSPPVEDLLELNRLAAERGDPPSAAAIAVDGAWPWSDEFGDVGPPGAVTAAAVHQSAVIVAGPFERSGTQLLNNVGRWQDGQWTPMGDGFPHGTVHAFFERGGSLYAAGAFTLTPQWDGVQLAVWDGQHWSAVPGPHNGAISDVASGNGGTLLAAGLLVGNGGQGLFMGNGTEWSAIDVGAEACSSCRADRLVRMGEWAYLAGSFASFGGKPLRNIARVRLLTSQLGAAFAVGDGLDGSVHDLVTLDGDVFAAGDFTHSGTVPLSRVARWDGAQWHAMGAGLDGSVRKLAVYRGQVVAAGEFKKSGATTVRHLAVWDGQRWGELAGGLFAAPTSLFAAGDQLLVSGRPRTLAAPNPSGALCRWDGTRWRQFGMGMDQPVRALAVVNDRLWAGGNFHSAGFSGSAHIAVWDGGAWSGVRAGTMSALNAVVAQDGEPVIAGPAVVNGSGGSSPWRRVARVHDDDFVPLGYGPDGEVLCLLPVGRGLVAGGTFVSTGQGPANHIARWDGAQWNPMGDGLDGNVHALEAFDGAVVAGGQFGRAGSVGARNVAAWNGSEWRALGEGMEGRVESLAVFRGQLYAGGHLGLSGGPSPRGIARWDGQSWEAVAGGLDGIVLALEPVGGLLIAGGWFAPTPLAGGSNLALFDGEQWRGVGSGLDGWVEDIVLFRDRVHLAGGFTRAGTAPSRHIARLELDLNPGPEPPRPHQYAAILGGVPAPNPFNPATSARFTTAAAGTLRVSVFDARGRLVRTLMDQARGPGSYEVRWDGTDDRGRTVAGGSYVLRIELNGGVLTRKLVMLK